MSRFASRAAQTAAGLLADRVLREPPSSWHPVARFGSLMQAIEDRCWSDRRSSGALYATAGALVGLVSGRVVGSTAVVVATATAGRELRRVAGEVGAALDDGDVHRARERLRALVGRDPSELDEAGIAAAAVESLAENTVDAVVSTAVWGAAGGAPWAAAHRAINTMDAMVGHRSERYRRFGTAAARLDDVANWIPARLFALTVLVARPNRARSIIDAVRNDASRHPSPNAGVAEAAVAGALDVELGGPLRYGTQDEVRPTLGTGRRPDRHDVVEAIVLVDQVERILVVALLVAAVAGAVRPRRT